ncbi:hypothetical protein Dsin_005044 [Dipteronia sinensis]|uniref:Histone deacetylase n=1 Tax=Dipteronia sinensis TaxID=43782 RepID=A0AAE0AW47_9ROSI|nr:hypothetical protein Dsin_005044 [Dipteronia sinensis]
MGRVNWVVRMRGDVDCMIFVRVCPLGNPLGIFIGISSDGRMCDCCCDEKVREIYLHQESFFPIPIFFFIFFLPSLTALAHCRSAPSATRRRRSALHLPLLLSSSSSSSSVFFFFFSSSPICCLGGGGYTIRNVARCCCYETRAALGMEVDDNMPEHEYYEYFGPEYTLHVAPSNMENKNSRQILDEIKNKLLDYLSKLQHAPSVQFLERPPDTELLEADEDQEDGDDRWDPDSDMDVDDECKPLPSRVKREMIKPEPKDLDDHKGTAEQARGFDTNTYETASAKILYMSSMSIDEPSVKVEQENTGKASDQMYPKS